MEFEALQGDITNILACINLLHIKLVEICSTLNLCDGYLILSYDPYLKLLITEVFTIIDYCSRNVHM